MLGKLDPAVEKTTLAFPYAAKTQAEAIGLTYKQKDFQFVAIRTADQTLDRGCIMHVSVNSNIVTAIASSLEAVINNMLEQLERCLDDAERVKLDEWAKKIISKMIEKRCTTNQIKGLDPVLGNFFREMRKHGEHSTRWDYTLKVMEIEIRYLAIERSKDDLLQEFSTARDILESRQQRPLSARGPDTVVVVEQKSRQASKRKASPIPV